MEGTKFIRFYVEKDGKRVFESKWYDLGKVTGPEMHKIVVEIIQKHGENYNVEYKED